ncbi:LacI family DNA-binding transcriptional regulator [uncultured Tateyamaria sp.]|uniref:LacI family DNA-binding transcriptional regulator n=1 Tax=uncultured Tateyamaria sp. TaxID=455651 RepID=UPI00261116AF|nr:LacI family DNA-binding transcriptional regulator [uncultured Tateyamaria sp.]
MTKSGTPDTPTGPTLESGERPTLKTIARLSGLAVPTVSRALADAPDIGKDTKARIRDIARQIGYRPNRAGVRLRTGRTNVISMVMSTEHDMMNHTARLISSVSSGIRHTPYHMIITPYFPDEDPMVPIRYIVETGSADGLIINQIEPEDPRVKYLMENKFPFVTHGRTAMCDQHAYFDYDNTAFGALAVRALAARGRTRIAMLAPPLTQTYGQNMVGGATQAAAELGVSFQVIPGADAHCDNPVIEQAMGPLYASDTPPDGLIASSIGGCVTMISSVEALGNQLTQDFDMVAKEAITFLRRYRAGIMIVDEDIDHAGNFLARALMHRISSPAEPPMQHLARPDPDMTF